MTRDRDYYRGLRDEELLEEARRGAGHNWEELGVALYERLADRLRDHWDGED
jgi:hypothetical protein